ncbi:aminodeoxychorismate synthase component I [Prolixibacteraceae bacterium Z1-6]|uniref:Aminodeoxychorismate synthase component I n=1 Tax=Draconibacterium aestuarii TaxID=2998507 RepID=A0A9X3F2I9_9BACT|nr:aminodeoxychorismate synthase component I [Prolixibacteraceae bacterium Z1-6]
MKAQKEITQQMNSLGKKGERFVFLIDFEGNTAHLFSPDETDKLLWRTPECSNSEKELKSNSIEKWEINPVSFKKYKKGFKLIQNHIHNGDTYLLNYTQPTPVKTNLSLTDIFHTSTARYKILLKNKFVCFSPEKFVRIVNGQIASYPMKGTMDATIKNSKELILKDSKEIAEHNTIVDLIRNDLSLVAENVEVEKFRYLERIKTNNSDLWQVSSKITGKLPENYTENIGDIIFTMLPAGSICGAPKKKTVEIIKAAENYERGFYTGIFGYFDGRNLDSCVLIRYIENQNGQLIYKSGGGITFLSEAEKEYDEMLKKVYIPIN